MSKLNHYWTEKESGYVDKFVLGEYETKAERDKVYTLHIYPALEKLIKGVKNNFKYKVPTHEIQSHIFEVLDISRTTDMYYDGKRTDTLFSYLTSIVRNYCIQQIRKNYKDRNTFTEFNDEISRAKKPAESDIDYAGFLDSFEMYLKHNRLDLFKPKEQIYVDFYLYALTKDNSLINSRTQVNDIREWADIEIDSEHYHLFKIKFNNMFSCLISQWEYDNNIDKNFEVSLYL